MESKVVYFESIKEDNTESTFNLVKERMNNLEVKKLVLASTTGATARKAMDFFKDSGVKLIVVPHQFDFVRKENPFPRELVTTLRDAGHEVHFGTMLFHTDSMYGSTTPSVMANLLRCFSQGVKVCFEIVLMATDAGYLKSGEKLIAMAGTGRGSDTALVMQAASSQNIKKLRVNEIICKPLNPLNIDELKGKMDSRKGDAPPL
ncbi:pyruvate kinase alpha/beta domain-containing protein [Desulfotruncus alcoholivorax]|uniref:pyruvate kinase alpha/beta domain-containing protein n=1 Tax=Desulfotruncus alcoholivorax TaxID=265477 RepID=UPI00040685C5|nr:pyruvate kinase alpha/beta domain-containing protein [Desulfotruncus alcoholivorax]